MHTGVESAKDKIAKRSSVEIGTASVASVFLFFLVTLIESVTEDSLGFLRDRLHTKLPKGAYDWLSGATTVK